MKKIIITRSQLNEIFKPNNESVNLGLGFHYEIFSKNNVYYLIFNINYNTENLGEYVWKENTPIGPDMKVKLHFDNVEPEVKNIVDNVLVPLGKTKESYKKEKVQFLSDEEPDVFRYGIYDCKDFIIKNINYAFNDFLSKKHYPDWQKEKVKELVSKFLQIIEQKNVNEVMDSQKTQVAFTGSNAVELGNNAQERYNDALRSGLKSNSIQLNGRTKNNNATDKDEAVITFDTEKGNIRDAVTDAVKNAVNNGVDINKLNVQGNSEDLYTNESKYYSKKQIEQARLYEMRKNGTILTKKQLTEEIITKRQLEELAYGDDKPSLIQKMNDMNMFQVFEAYRQTFGDEALQELSNHWNTMQEIVNVVYSSDEQKQQEFLARLDGTYEDNDDETFELDLS